MVELLSALLEKKRHWISRNRILVSECLQRIGVNLWSQKKMGPIMIVALLAHHAPT